MAELETEVKLLKKELQDQAKIHDRLDVAIEKLTDVSNSINRMLAVPVSDTHLTLPTILLV